MNAPQISRGLENVTVDESKLTFIDGQRGLLRYRGADVGELAEHFGFTDCVAFLIEGKLTQNGAHAYALDPREDDDFDTIYEGLAKSAAALPAALSTMSALQALVLSLSSSTQGEVTRVFRYFSLCVLLAHFRTRIDLDKAKESLTKPSAFLTLLTGARPSEKAAAVFNACQILQLEHGLNASTFAARIATSTRAGTESALAAAIATLSGSLHGGADAAAYRFALSLRQHATPIDEQVSAHLRSKKRIMGLGHRVYKTTDPRAIVLRRLADELSAEQKGESRELFEVFEQIDLAARQTLGDHIRPNVEFYKGIVFSALRVPPSLFTPVFAMARVGGWLAHIVEQRENNRLLRPRLLYTGPTTRKLEDVLTN